MLEQKECIDSRLKCVVYSCDLETIDFLDSHEKDGNTLLHNVAYGQSQETT